MAFFLKELRDRPIRVPGGWEIGFEDAGGNIGILSTEDGYVISELKAAESRKAGGVYEIDQARYEELKKKQGRARLSPKSLLNVIRQDHQEQAKPNGQPAVADIEVGEPLSIPESIPTTRKVSEITKRKKRSTLKSRLNLEDAP